MTKKLDLYAVQLVPGGWPLPMPLLESQGLGHGVVLALSIRQLIQKWGMGKILEYMQLAMEKSVLIVQNGMLFQRTLCGFLSCSTKVLQAQSGILKTRRFRGGLMPRR